VATLRPRPKALPVSSAAACLQTARALLCGCGRPAFPLAPAGRPRAVSEQQRAKRNCATARVRSGVPEPVAAIRQSAPLLEIILFLPLQSERRFPVRKSAESPLATLPDPRRLPGWRDPGVHRAPGNAGAGGIAE